jgi:hypothetical protein
MKRIAIVQSNYIPWKGYFDMINMVDEFVIYDDAQYTKRDWRNRNQIKTKDGPIWLTIPVEVKNKYQQIIRETKVASNKWANNHLKIIKYNYSRAGCYSEMIEWIDIVYGLCEKELFLSDINLVLIKEISEFLGIKTKLSFSSDYIIEGNKSDKIMNICVQSGAKEYLSGPAAKSYLDLSAFEKAGIAVKWMNYSSYREYSQLFPPFIHTVSILDVILNVGADTSKYLNSFQDCLLQESFP